MKKIILSLITTIVALSAIAQTPSPETKTEESATGRVISWYNEHLNYGTVTLLMTIESSFIPFPSEVIVPPAAYQACNSDNDALYVTSSKFVNVLLIILFATLGALIGALINYVLALWLGRPIIYWFADSKVGHMLLLDSAKVQKAEDYFREHGNVSTLVGRFIPAIRQLISIPAGLAKMHIGKFILFTSIGAACWNTVLAILGYVAHGQKDLIDKYNHELTIALLAVFAIGVGYVIIKWIVSARRRKNSENVDNE
ncbi:MAG: DedA family protein [Bacteroidales bacterium]|nr:DedA family protein [Bacteroidales bacterium]